jgi:hypothetical protein
MARLGWGGSIATAIGVAAGTGAAQLGFGYGLGIIDWAAAAEGEPAWVASLAWSTWIAATSTIAGAVCAQRLRRRPPPTRGVIASVPADATPANPPPTPDDVESAVPDDVRPSTASEVLPGVAGRPSAASALALALASAVGALLTVLLVAVPARAATLPGVTAPQTVAAWYAALGVLLGLLMAVWALRSAAAAANVIATVGWLWGLAVAAVLDGVLSGRGLTSAQLGIWQFSADGPELWLRGWFYWPGAVLALGSASLIGALAARRTARSPQRRLGAAVSGAAGPLLVSLAYLLAVPGLGALGREQVSAHIVAPYAVVAGLAGSVLAAGLAQRSAARRPGVAVTVPRQRTADAAAAGSGQGLAPGAGESGASVTAGEATTEPPPSTAPRARRGRRAR